MGPLAWTRVGDGDDSLRYRIRRNAHGAAASWRLETATRTKEGTRTWVAHSLHPSRRRARARADDLERVRVQRIRVLGHATVGVVAAVVFAAAAAWLNGLLTFGLMVGALYLTLRSLAAAVAVWLGDSWGWTRDGGLTPPKGRFEAYLLERADKREMDVMTRTAADDPSSVRVLPPK